MFIFLTLWFFYPSPLLPHRRVSHTSPATGHCLVKPLCWAPSTASGQWVPHLPRELATWSLHEVWPWLCVPTFVDCHPKMIQPHSNATCSMESTQKLLHSKKLEIHIDTNNQQTTLVGRKCYTESSNVQDKFWLIPELISCVGLAERLETTTSSKPKPSDGWPCLYSGSSSICTVVILFTRIMAITDQNASHATKICYLLTKVKNNMRMWYEHTFVHSLRQRTPNLEAWCYVL